MTSDVVDFDFDPFRSGQIERVAPTTEPQREIITSAGLGREANLAFNEAVSLRIRGPLAVDVVAAALQTIVERHEALRTTFTPQLDELCVTSGGRFNLERIDLVAESAERQEEIVQATWQRLAGEPMSLTEGPLFRGVWLQLGPDDAELVLLAHHVVCDGWSFHVILQELSRLCAGDPPADLPPAPSFADFATEQQSLARANDDLGFWRRRFAAKPAVLDLPTDHVRPPRRTFAARRLDHVFGDGARKAIVAGAGRLRASVVSTVLAGTAVLLHRLTGSTDVVIGLPVARQGVGGPEGLVGHAVQLLPIRLAIDPDDPFRDLVDRVKSAVLDASEHHDFTFGTLVRSLGLSGDLSRVPLNPVVFNIDQPFDELTFGPARVTLRTVPRCAESFEIFLNVLPSRDRLVLEATYNTGLFSAATIASWLAALETLLLAGVESPERTVGALRMVRDANGGTVLRGPEVPVAFECWHHALDRAAAATPDAIAVVDADRSVSYGELAGAADRLARVLVARGVGPGAVVGVCMQRSHRLPIALAAIHRAGAAHLPLDPNFPEARLRIMVEDSGCRLVLADLELPAGVAGSDVECLQLPLDAATPTPQVELPATGGDDLAYVIYTSGSTGRPKGVEVGHRALANLLASMAVEPGFGAADALLSVTTISFDISLLELLLPLTVGGRLVVATREESTSPDVLARLLEDHSITMLQATPSSWRLLLGNGWRGKPDLVALCGGEPMPQDLASALLQRVGALFNVYGPTETTVWSTIAEVRAGQRIHIGLPIHNTDVHVLDQGLAPLPIGCPGEICIGGLGLARGYRERPELTADRFVDHPGLGRLYRTGDRGFVSGEGRLHCLGRIDHQVKVRGFRIELGEIEAALAACPGVAGAVATTRVDEGGGDARLIAYLVAEDAGELPAVHELKSRIRDVLPEYMVPQHLVWIPGIPLLPNGKIDRKSLPEVDLAADPGAAKVAPATGLEQSIAEEMAAVLGMREVGATDGFFDLGGHSLLAAQLAAKLNQRLGTSLSMLGVFEAPTVRQLARAIESGRARPPGRDATAIARRNERRSPVTALQQRMWLLQQMRPDLVTYNLPSAHRLRGRMDEAAFERALQTVVRRQPSLRTSFERSEGSVWQIVHDEVDVGLLPAEDLRSLPQDVREAALMRRLDELTAEPFDLAQAPLFRARLFRTGDEEHVLFFMPHHIVWDGWSFDLFYDEMAALYGAHERGDCALPELPIGPGDYAAWLADWLASGAAATQREFWRARMREFGPIRPLPTDLPRSAGMLGNGASLWVTIDADRVERLRKMAKEAGATLFTATLAIYCAVLCEHADEDRLAVAIPLRGRERPELEHLMACCNGLVPLTLDLGGAASFLDVLTQVRDVVMQSLEHPDLSLEEMVGAHGGEQQAAAAVLYQALFSFQDVRGRQRQWGSLSHEMLQVFQRGATEDLGMWLLESASGLQGAFTYNTDLLRPATAERLRTRYLEIVDAVLAAPAVALDRLLAPVERRAQRAGDGGDPAIRDTASTVDAARRPRGGAPVSDLEILLAKAWENALGIEPIGRDDDFFELGGNSLSAIRMVFDFEAMSGVTMELGEVFRSPTIAGLAAAMRSGAANANSLIVPLQGKGTGTPLLCLLGIGVYGHLATGLGTAQRVYGLYVGEERQMAERELKGLPPQVSIDRLVDGYIELILRSKLPEPYRLAGVSFGGVVAMEVANRLAKAGHRVELVVLLDSILPQGYSRTLLKRVAGSAKAAIRRLSQVWSAAGNGQAPVAGNAQALAMEVAAGEWAARQASVPCPVVLYRAQDTSAWGHGVEFLPDYAWGRIAGDRLTVVQVPGDHLGILRPPNVGVLCASLRRILGTS